MLVDLQEKLREIGRLDVYKSVGDKALEYFAELRAEDVSKKTLAQRARNLRQIGEVSMDQGEWSAALAAFNESLLITEKLAAFDRQNAEAQIDLANSHFYVGHVHWQRGELKEARLHFETVLPIVDAVSEREPDNTNWLSEKGYAYTNLGRVLELEGALEAALVAYTGVMTANQQLVALEPENPEWELELGFAHNNIGKLITALGQLDEAESHYRKDLEIKARIYAGKPAHNYWRSYLGVSQFYLGQLLVLKGNYPEAETHLLAALDNFDFLVEVDPYRHNWVVRRANIVRELGKLNVMSARIDRGSEYLESSIKVLNELVKSNQENPGWRRNLTWSLLYASNHESRQGESDVAVEHLDAAKLHIAKLIEQEPNDRETQLLAVRADLCEAQVADNRDSGSDQAVLQSALVKLGQYFPETSDPRVLELEMLALMGLDRPDDARLIQERLQLMGFMGQTT
jgi:tetratricopeptide (TPR) repeat protein